MGEWEAGLAEGEGEEYVPDLEIARLHEALEHATDESREEFYATYTPFVAWEEDVRQRNADAQE